MPNRCSVPLNESLESREGFRDSYCGLDFKTRRACRGRANTDQMAKTSGSDTVSEPEASGISMGSAGQSSR